MQNLTLFGNRSHKKPAKTKGKKKHRLRTLIIVLLSLILFGEGVYFYLCSTDNAFVNKWRTMYIQTAMSTMSHQWLATALLPEDLVTDAVALMQQGMEDQIGQNSSWDIPDQTLEKEPEPEEPVEDIPAEEDTRPYWIRLDPEGADAFFDLFWELDQDSMIAYLDTHPEAMDNGWEHINIDEAGLDQDGTSIKTINGDQVLAVNSYEGILLIRVTGSTYRGVLAVAKDPSRLGMRWSAGIGSYGQTCKTICERNDAILGMSASGFDDPNGMGNGGILIGYAMCDGEGMGRHSLPGYKRIELRSDDRMYIVDAPSSVHPDTTDATEFYPALVVDSRVVVDETCNWTGMHPRAIMGQNELGEVQMLVIEGRQLHSMGVSVVDCAELLSTYRCAQAMNMDGGTTAMMYYNGRSIISCSHTALENGRTLPNAWCYFPKDTIEE